MLLPAVALAFALAAGSALAGGAPGQTVRIETTLVMKETFPAFHGRVKAENAACVGQRTVKLFERKRGGTNRLLGKTTSRNSGRWRVIVDPLASGAYFARAGRVVQGTAGTIFVCKPDRSQIAVVD